MGINFTKNDIYALCLGLVIGRMLEVVRNINIPKDDAIVNKDYITPFKFYHRTFADYFFLTGRELLYIMANFIIVVALCYRNNVTYIIYVCALGILFGIISPDRWIPLAIDSFTKILKKYLGVDT